MSLIAQRLQNLNKDIPPHVQVVAVSKNHPASAILQAYQCGQRCFGESRPQELLQKVKQLPQDIIWHFIGHLQTNKIKMVVPYVQLIHAVDSEKLLLEIEKFCAQSDLSTQVLLQVHIAREEHKFGFSPQELLDFFSANKEKNYPHISIKGLMGIASNTDDAALVEAEFLLIQKLLQQVQTQKPQLEFSQLSLGMSGDFQAAIAAGSTLLRIGTAIFGERNYSK